MEPNIENANSQTGESTQTQTGAAPTETVDAAALQARVTELEQTNSQLFARAKTAEGFVKVDGKWVKAPKPEEAAATQQKLEAKTGENEELLTLLLATKGIEDEDEVALFKNFKSNTGKKDREILASKYFQQELKDLREEKAAKSAIPGNTKRSGSGAANDVDHFVAKIQSGAMKLNDIPDFTTRAAVVQAMQKPSDDSVPPWRK